MFTRKQLLTFVALTAFALIVNWVYEYQLFIPSEAVNKSIFETTPTEIGAVSYWAAGWPIKFYYASQYEGLPILAASSVPSFFSNLLLWALFIGFFVFYESHIKRIFSHKSAEPVAKQQNSRISVMDLFTVTLIIAAALVYWRWQEGICAAHVRLADEIRMQKGSASLGIFLPKRLQNLPDFVKNPFKRLVEVNLIHPEPELVDKSLALPYLTRFSTLGGDYDLRKLRPLKEKTFLRSLRVGGRRVDPEFVGLVATLHQIQTLHLMRTNITARSIEVFGDLPRLRQLNFMHTDVKLAELKTPGFAKTLRFLETGHPEPGQPDHFRLDNWPELLQLTCNEFETIESSAPMVLEISNLPKLRHIVLDLFAIYDLQLDNLPELTQIDNAKYQLDRRFAPDGDGSAELRLRTLTLGTLPKLSSIKFYCPALRELNFSAPCNTALYASVSQWTNAPNVKFGTRVVPAERVTQWLNAVASENGPRQLVLTDIDFHSTDLSALAKSPRLEYLNLSGTRIEDRHILQMRGMPQLQTLILKRCNVSGNAISTLTASLPNLKKLHCEERTLGRIKLENQPHLTTLFGARDTALQLLDAVKIVGMKSLAEAFELPRELFYLHVEDAPALTGLSTCGPWPDKAVFKGVRDLRFFTAGGPQVTDAVVEELLACSELQSLTLAYTSASPAMLTKLAQLTRLKYLALSGSNVDDEVMAALATLKSLETLRLDETKITDRAMETISQYPRLTKLVIGQNAITDEGLGKLKDMKGLVSLNLSGLTLGERANSAFASLEDLRELNLANCQFGPDTLLTLGGLQLLRSLDLSGTEAHDRALRMLAQQLPQLTFGLSDAKVESTLMLELGSIDRLMLGIPAYDPIAQSFELAQERAALLAGFANIGSPPGPRQEIEPEMFSPDWQLPPRPQSPAMGGMGAFADGAGPLNLQQQMLLEEQDAMRDTSLYVSMSIFDSIGYALGEVFSAAASVQSKTSPTSSPASK